MKKLYTVSEAAVLSHLSPALIRRACQSGRLESQLIGKTYVFAPADFNAWLDQYEAEKRKRKEKCSDSAI